MIYNGSSGTSYEVIQEGVRVGGEGGVYNVKGKPSIVLKAYKDDQRNGKEEKVRAVMTHAKSWSSKFKEYSVPPLELVYSADGSFVGYIMRKFDQKFTSLNAVYDADAGKHISYPNKVITAMNLCVETMLAHDCDVVIGDYNQKNIGVGPDGRVTLFDNDSFQVKYNGKVQKCIVGVQEEMAPEILNILKKEKADLITVSKPVYNEYTDNYTLALHVFHLLMNGAHPFNSRIDASKLPDSKTVSSATISMLDAARNAVFTFAHPTLFRKPPAWAPSYDILTDELKDCFERAFVDGLNDPEKRPKPQELYSALHNYYKGLEKRSCGHYLHKDYKGSCEWCRALKS